MSHETRHDTTITNRLRRAALLFCVASLAMFGVLVWIYRTGGVEPANVGHWVGFLTALALLAGSAVYAFVAVARVLWFYRCPECGGRVSLVPGTDRVGSRMRYECAACGVEWDTGWTVAPSD